MKVEIKEILDKLKDKNNYISHSMILLSIKETTLILDYITNLQEYYNDNVNKYEELLVKYSNLQREQNNFKTAIDESSEIVGALEEKIETLNNIIDECADRIMKELNENNHLSIGVALSIRHKLLIYKELERSK